MIASSTQRLSAATRELAQTALSGEWGRGMSNASPTLDGRAELQGLSNEMKCAHAVRIIAQEAPLRVLPNERVVGSATLAAASYHVVPAALGTKPVFEGTSHTTIAFGAALKIGYAGLRGQIDDRLARGGLDADGLDTLAAMRLCLDAAGIWHRRHMDLLAERIAAASGPQRDAYARVRQTLANVPENPPQDFRQAVQSLWFMFAFQRLCGNWSGVGRIDKMLGPYLHRDLAAGLITLDEAREWIAHFWIHGCEWLGEPAHNCGSGDAQYYQNVVLGGVDEAGCDITNDVTYLVLDVVEELRINEFPIAVRLGPQSPQRLLRRIADVQRLGGGMVAIYNEAQIIQSLVDFGYPLEEARDFCNDGCWEIIIQGKTCFGYAPLDTLAMLQSTLGVVDIQTAPGQLEYGPLPSATGTAPVPRFEDFESLYAAFRSLLEAKVAALHTVFDGDKKPQRPAPLLSVMVEGCIENARDYHNGGPRYMVRSPHAGGLADTGNSLLAIKTLVFDEQRLTLDQLVTILRNNWDGQEELRRQVMRQIEFYGNGNAQSDAMVKRVFDDFLAAVAKVTFRNGILRPPGVSTFGREIDWRAQRGATAVGRRKEDVLAMNFSPSPGTDLKGPTAVIRSHCAMDLKRLTNGTAIELKMHPSSVEGEAGVAALVSLMQTFLKLGGIFMHIDVVDNAVLRDAQANPEKYQGLAVRVSGWSARFVTLNKDWQEMVINRSTQRA